jgi:hypothetical protein
LLNVAFAQQRRSTDGIAVTVDDCFDTASRQRAEVGGVRHFCSLFGSGHDGPRQRMFAVGLDAPGEPEDFRLVDIDAETPVTACSPLVRVPVLSNKIVSTVRVPSSANRFLMRMPARAPTAVDSEMTNGIAKPSACGHAITSTVTVLVTASFMLPNKDQTTNVTIAEPAAT